MKLSTLSLRARLTLLMLLISGVVMLLMRGAFFTYEYLAFRQVTLRQLATLGEVVAANSTAALAFDNEEDAREVLAALRAESHIMAAVLYDPEGRPFAHYPGNLPAEAIPPSPGAEGYRFAGAHLAGFQPVLQRGHRLGTLYLQFDTGVVMREWAWDMVRIGLAMMAVVLLAAYLLSRRLERRISQPILALAATARAVSERRDYTVRAVKHSDDEIGLLTDAFNQLLVQIDAQKRALDAHAIVAITDPQGRINYVNDKFCAISKYAREELLGQDHRIINSGHHPKAFFRGLWTTIGRGQIWHGEVCNRAKDGTLYWVDTTIVPYLDAAGKPYQYVAIRADITARKRVEEDIRQLNHELEQRVAMRTAQLEGANKELEAFSYSVSHDLRAPLRHIDGFTQLLQKRVGATLDPTAQRHLETISNSARNLGVLIDELLLFCRMGRAELRQTNVDMAALLKEVIAAQQLDLQGRDLEWRIGPLPVVPADPAMLRQVWANLIGNAVKYSRHRAKAVVTVAHRLDPADGHVFSVNDNGAGFDMQYSDKLFGVFQRLHSPREFEGTGIGLANVQRIVLRHGGRVWAQGAVDVGATFYFSLPATPAGPAATHPQSSKPS